MELSPSKRTRVETRTTTLFSILHTMALANRVLKAKDTTLQIQKWCSLLQRLDKDTISTVFAKLRQAHHFLHQTSVDFHVLTRESVTLVLESILQNIRTLGDVDDGVLLWKRWLNLANNFQLYDDTDETSVFDIDSIQKCVDNSTIPGKFIKQQLIEIAQAVIIGMQ